MVFHRLCETANPFRPGTLVEDFDRICRHLKEHYQVLSLEELELRRCSRQPSPSAVAITFDDGYADNYHLALPILRRYNLPATVFITTGCMEGKNILWTSRLAWILEYGQLPANPLIIRHSTLAVNTPQERLHTLGELKEQLKQLDQAEREEIISQIAEAMQVDDLSLLKKEMLTWDQLAEMDAAGFVAGAHTINHPILARESPAQIRVELSGSREELESRLKHRVDFFAYPNGGPNDFNGEVAEAVRRAGYRLACSMIFGANTFATDAYWLRRVSIYAENFPEIALQLERFFYLTT